MKIAKIILIIIAVILSVLTIGYFSLFFYLKSYFNDNLLKEKINNLSKNKFNKAVYFEKIYLDYRFDIKVKNIKISNNDDFNDEKILLDCPTIILKLDKKSLMDNNFSVKQIVLLNAKMNFQKSYDTTYEKFLKDNFAFLNTYKNIFEIIKSDVLIKNSSLSYFEYYSEGNLVYTINIDKSEIKYNEDDLDLNLIGKFNDKTDSNCKINLKSKIIKDDSFYGKIISDVEITNYNISSINKIMYYKYNKSYLFSGNCDFKLKFIYNNSIFKYDLISNFKSFGLTEKNMDYMLVSKLFMQMDTKGSLNINDKYFNLNSKNILNEDSKIEFYYNYDNKKTEIKIISDVIDLNQLSNYINPYNISDYSGSLKFNINLKNDLNKHEYYDYKIDLNIDDLNIFKIVKGKNTNILKNFDSNIEINKETANVIISGNSSKSDFHIDFKKYPVNNKKIKFNNDLIFKSNNFELEKIIFLKNKIITKIYDISKKEKENNYSEIYFQDRELGKFLNTRNFNFNFKIDNILVQNNKLNNLEYVLKLEHGKLYTEKFALNGFNGNYSLDIKSNLYSYWPLFEYEFSADNIDISKVFYKSNEGVTFGGVLSIKEKYTSNFYRPAHFLENAYYTFSTDIYNGEILDLKKKKELRDFFKSQNIEYDFNNFKLNSFNYNRRIISEEETINRFNANTNLFNFKINSSVPNDNYEIPFSIISNDYKQRNKFYLIHDENGYKLSGKDGNNILVLKGYVTE